MTEEINFFQALFFSNTATTAVNQHEAKLVKALIKDAKTTVEIAETEAAHGETLLNLLRMTRKNKELKQNMATIAVWHFERSLGKYQDAAARYGEAGRVQTKNSRVFFAEARAMAKRADETGEIVELLNKLLAK